MNTGLLEAFLEGPAHQRHHPRIALRVQYFYSLFNGLYSGQRISAHQIVVQGGHWQTRDKRVQPHGDFCQLHCNIVIVDAVDAVAGYLAAEQH